MVSIGVMIAYFSLYYKEPSIIRRYKQNKCLPFIMRSVLRSGRPNILFLVAIIGPTAFQSCSRRSLDISNDWLYNVFRNGINFMRRKITRFSSGLWHYVKEYSNQNHAVLRGNHFSSVHTALCMFSGRLFLGFLCFFYVLTMHFFGSSSRCWPAISFEKANIQEKGSTVRVNHEISRWLQIHRQLDSHFIDPLACLF